MPSSKRSEAFDEDDELEGGSDGRRPKAYVRFDRTKEKQSGPMYGPFDAVNVSKAAVVGWVRHSGEQTNIAEQRPEGWVLSDRKEPPYPGFTVVFS